MPVEQGGEHHVSTLLRAEQSAAPDCLQRPLLRRSRFRQQVSLGVRRLTSSYSVPVRKSGRDGKEETGHGQDD
jgi:hypothetical protein